MIRLAVMSLLLTGCMPFRYYPLPVPPTEARATFAPIATAASNLGWKYWQWEDSVSAEPDRKTRLTYMFDAAGNYVLCVSLKEKDPPNGRDAAFAHGKKKGDELWQRAMALRPPPTPVQIVVPVMTPPPVEVIVR